MESYDHLITIDKDTSILKIHRILSNGNHEFLTSIQLSTISTEKNFTEYESLAKNIGETVLMDSPLARAILKI